MNKERVLTVLTVLPIILGIIAMLILPAEVATHYSMSLQVTQYGSKFLLLLVGVIALLLGGFLKFIYKACKEKDSGNLVFGLSVIALIVFNIMNALSLIGAYALS